MKTKVIALTLAMVAGMAAANAQATYKGKDVFVGLGAGVVSPFNPSLNTPSVYGNLQVGAYITPVWGVRGVIGGPFQTLDENYAAGVPTNAYDGTPSNVRAYSNKLFGELNLDGILNISNIFADDLAKLDFYVFAGPTMNLSTEGTVFSQKQDALDLLLVEESDALKVRVGATAGAGLAYNFTPSFALGVEGRFGVTPSIFGDADIYRKAEGTGRLTLNGVWTIGGKHGKFARAAAAAAAAGYISKEAADAMVAEALKNPRIVEKVVEKEVIKEVEKLVNNEVPASTAVFFEIGKAVLTAKDKARLSLFAESLKACEGKVFEVAGYCDKKTGSVKFNQTLSEKRAQVVYDYLVGEGVPASKLEKTANGGVDPIFFNNDVLSRTVIIRAK